MHQRSHRWTFLIALLSTVTALPVVQANGTADTQNPRLHLTWRAPHGMPRATDRVGTSCADSSTIDTLYLSFEPTLDESAFVSLGGEIMVYPQAGDSIGPFWRLGKGDPNRGGMIMQFGPDESIPGTSAWDRTGIGLVDYDWTSTRGRFRFLYALTPDSRMHLKKGERYTAGRIFLRGVSAGLQGCDSPMRLQWRNAEFVFSGRPDYWRNCKSDDSVSVARGAGAPADTVPPSSDDASRADGRSGVERP